MKRKEIEDLCNKRNLLFLKEKEAIEKLIGLIDATLSRLQEEKDSCKVLSAEHNLIHEQLLNAKTELSSLKGDFDTKKDNWLQRFSPYTLEKVQKEFHGIQVKEEEIIKLRGRIEKSIPFILKKQNEVAVLSEDSRELKLVLTQKEYKLNYRRQKIIELENEILNVIGNEKLNKVMDQKLKELHLLHDNYKKTNDSLNECKETIEIYERKIVRHIELFNNKQQEYNLTKHSLEEELSKTNFTSINAVRQALLSEKEKFDLEEQLLEFNEFLAEEILNHVLLLTSRHLLKLTNGRYGVEVDKEVSFRIRDVGNGEVKREVSMLSGGEKLILSLAFAVSYSEYIQLTGKYPLQCYFLDEGLGALDRDLHETVITSLIEYSSDIFSIGIITHIPEAKKRIINKLIVSPAILNRRGSLVKLEFQ